MIKTFKLVENQIEKTVKDNVEVIITEVETFTNEFKKTAGQSKAESERLANKIIAVQEQKARVDAETIEIEKEADKFILTEK